MHIPPSLFRDKFVGEEQRKRPSTATAKPVILVVSPLNAPIENLTNRSCQGHTV